MIAFRQVDARYPFLWDDASQPAARWHAEGEGPAHYFADTPDGAWAELLRHEEIVEPADLLTIRRQMWAVEIGEAPAERVALPLGTVTGGPETYAACQDAARAARARGVHRLAVPTAALEPGGARAWRVDHGVAPVPAPARDGVTIIVYGPAVDLPGWMAAEAARPSVDLLERVHHY
jgi:RES domain